jgi:hypothetical protein
MKTSLLKKFYTSLASEQAFIITTMIFIFISLFITACKKTNEPGVINWNDPPVKVRLTPANGSTQPPTFLPDFRLKILVTSVMPSDGVRIIVSAAPDGSSNPFYTKNITTTQPETDLIITGTPPTGINLVSVTVKSLNNITNESKGSYRYSHDTFPLHPIYTDVNPDQTFDTNGSVYHLDLNNDGINDFDISYTTSVVTLSGHCSGTQTNNYIEISPLNQNEVGGNSTEGVPAVASNIIINGTAFGWNHSTNQLLESTTWGQCSYHPGHHGNGGLPSIPAGWFALPTYSGHWPGAINKYVALRLHLGSNIYYGWVRLDVPGGSGWSWRFTIKDYAFNGIASQPIFAGQH